MNLRKVPQINELQQAYAVLQNTNPKNDAVIPVQSLVEWSQWCRFDPRLGEELIVYVKKHWSEINPMELQKELKNWPWPAGLGVLLEHVKLQLSKRDLTLFSPWMECVMAGTEPAKYEQFFIGLYAFAGKEMQKQVTQSTKPYLHWGYFARDLMLNKSQTTQTLMPLNQRMQLLQQLLQVEKTITVNQYRQKLKNLVSRRQAQRDLVKHPNLKPIGYTRNRKFQVVV